MTTSVSALDSALTLPNGQVLRNRIMKSAMSEDLGAGGGSPDARLERLYARWSTGGYGLIVTGNVMVDRRHLGEPGNVVVEDDRDLGALRRWATAARDGGAAVWMQLNHPGRQANPVATGEQAVAPSVSGPLVPGLPRPRALAGDEILDVVARFATAARVADEAGFDGVQIHGAHGYLVSQFLSPLTNRRDDGWGGDVTARARFVLEVLRAVRAAVRPGFGVGIKLNSADFQRGGFTERESRDVVGLLAAEGIDLIEISGGSYESPAMMGRPRTGASTAAREAYFLEHARTVREVARDVPLAVTGGFRTPAGMADAVSSGACDVVGFARPAAVLPDAGDRARSGVRPLPSRTIRLPGAAPGARMVEGALDLQWHTDQLHRMGSGREPDPDRSPWRTAATMLRRNGLDAVRGRRRIDAGTRRAVRKFRAERLVGRYVANPLVAALGRLGVRTALATELETTGRRTGLARTVPVSALFDDDGAWVISQHGRRSGWGRNVDAESRVRIRRDGRWRSGVARFVDGDDVVARARGFAPHPLVAPLTAATFRALQSDPVSVRITFTDGAVPSR